MGGYDTTQTHVGDWHTCGASGVGSYVRVRKSSKPRDQVGMNEGYETCPFINLQCHTIKDPYWRRNLGMMKAENKSPANALDSTLPKAGNTQSNLLLNEEMPCVGHM